MKQTLMALAFAAMLAGCGGSDSNDSPPPATGGGGDGGSGDGGTTSTEISGSAMAPGGSVAQLRPDSPFQLVMNFLISPAAAAITGLAPVENASVELIRIDNDGNELESLDSTTTDADGAYTLELPEGEELGGDLVVEIVGTGVAKMRAQVLAQQVDITPVSEYVLQKFIASDADLASLPAASVTELKQQVESLDLVAGTDLTSLLATLDQEIGEFVDEALAVIVATPGDGAEIAGDYRNVAIQWGFDQGPQNESGGNSYMIDMWITDIVIADGASGQVNLQINAEHSGFADLSQHGIWAEQASEILDESITFSIAADGTMSYQQGLEEDARGDYTEQSPAKVYNFRKVPGRDLFVLEANDVANYYSPTDTDGDGIAELGEIVGHEIFRGIEFMAKKPSNGDANQLSGDFGRVYLGTFLQSHGYMQIETEANILTFDGVGTVDITEAARHTLSRHADGTTDFFQDVAAAELDLPYDMSADGQMIFEGEAADVFLNDSFDVLVGSEFWLTEDATAGDNNYADADHSLTLAVKLPEQPLTIDQRVYRVLHVENEFSEALGLNSLRFSSILTMTGATTASLDANITDVNLGVIAVENETIADVPLAVELAANGAATFTLTEDGGDTFVMEGFLNQNGSLGIFQTRYTPSGQTSSALGVAVLVEISP